MADSVGPSPLLFVIVILALLVWQVFGNIGPEYSLLYLIGSPWRSPVLAPESPPSDPDLARALMVWANEGGAVE